MLIDGHFFKKDLKGNNFMSDELNLVKEILGKMDSLDKNVDSINITLAVQAEQLREHMKRSDNLEAYINKVEIELKPVHQHVNRVNALMLLLAGILGLIGAIEGILKILNLLH